MPRVLQALVPNVCRALHALMLHLLHVRRPPRALVPHEPCALRALVPHMPHVLCALMFHVPRALLALVPYVPGALCGLVPHVFRALRTLISHGLLCILPSVIHAKQYHLFCSCFPNSSLDFFLIISSFLGNLLIGNM